MFIIGLTGSIGMGKSAAAATFWAHSIPVIDADAEVHALYRGGAVAPIEAAFPGSTTVDGVDRQKLGALLLAKPSGFKTLEAIVHPLVQAAERAHLLEAQASGAWAVVLEVPLLFETGGDKNVDATVVVSAPSEMQKARVLARPGMTEAKLAQILSRQWPDAKKRAAATFIVDTSGTMASTAAQIGMLVAQLKADVDHKRRTAEAFDHYWRDAAAL
jgi:dephospho-CoA kinase